MSIAHETLHDEAGYGTGPINPRTSAFQSLYAMQSANPEGFQSFVSMLASGAMLSTKGTQDLEADAQRMYGDDTETREAYRRGRALLEYISEQDGLPAHFEHNVHGHTAPATDDAGEITASDGGGATQPPAGEQPAGQP